MSHRHSALAIAAIVMGSALGGAALRPGAAEAQVYDDAGPRPYAYHGRENGGFGSGRGWVDHRGDADTGLQAYPHHHPAEYDGRDHGASAYGWRRPPRGYDERRWGWGDDHRGYGARFDTPYATSFPDQPSDVYPLGADPYEEIAAPVAPPFDDGRGPDVGCTIRRSESITAAGWRKIVTHRTCYQR